MLIFPVIVVVIHTTDLIRRSITSMYMKCQREKILDVVCFFFEGKVSKWWRWLKFQFEQDNRRLRWTAFEKAFMEQWGPSSVINHHGQLAKLKQEDKITDYIEEFRRL